jgi:hypothetical protein
LRSSASASPGRRFPRTSDGTRKPEYDGLGEARESAKQCRELVLAGKDPIIRSATPNAAQKRVGAMRSAAPSGARSLRDFAYPVFGALPVDQRGRLLFIPPRGLRNCDHGPGGGGVQLPSPGSSRFATGRSRKGGTARGACRLRKFAGARQARGVERIRQSDVLARADVRNAAQGLFLHLKGDAELVPAVQWRHSTAQTSYWSNHEGDSMWEISTSRTTLSVYR